MMGSRPIKRCDQNAERVRSLRPHAAHSSRVRAGGGAAGRSELGQQAVL